MLSKFKKLASGKNNKMALRTRGRIITAVDVGTSKVNCLIAELDLEGTINIIGVGQQLSKGIKSGVVVDMEEVELSIVNAVHTAEKMAGITVRDIVVNINGPHIYSQNIGIETPIGGHAVDETDVKRIMAQARSLQENQNEQLLHILPTTYAIDGVKGIHDPRGMFGESLGVNLHLIRGNRGPIYNLAKCIARSHLEIGGMVISSLASGLATTVEDEIELGVTVIDIGGGTTSVAAFYEGNIVHSDVVPLGGVNITNDIARCFSCSLANAERAKVLYGSTISSVSDDREIIMIPQVGEGKHEMASQLPKSALVAVIKPRVEEIFELVKQKLAQTGIDRIIGRRVVLTGGTSQLAGVREMAAHLLEKNVRLGKPLHIGPGEIAQDASFATCAGLLSYAQVGKGIFSQKNPWFKSEKTIHKLSSWIRGIW